MKARGIIIKYFYEFRSLMVQYSPHAEIGNMILTFYHLNSILNPVIYAIRLPEFRRTLKGLFYKKTSTGCTPPIELRAT